MIGLGTYSFFWHHWAENPDRIDVHEALRRTRELGVDLFQICDFAPLDLMSASELAEIRATAVDLGITLEVGTKGVGAIRLSRYLEIAVALDATLVRSMLFAPDSRPTLAEAEDSLRGSMTAFADAGVTLALETYEQVSTRDLVGVIEGVGHPLLGICLDPANAVAALENPRDVIDLTAPYVKNIHVKDFAFTRRGGWVGFTLEGARLGEGLLDYDYLIETVRPDERGINRIVEHWLPLHDTLDETLSLEDDWNTHNLRVLNEQSLRSNN
jgi:sugar phosphate isomerase/epimerase